MSLNIHAFSARDLQGARDLYYLSHKRKIEPQWNRHDTFLLIELVRQLGWEWEIISNNPNFKRLHTPEDCESRFKLLRADHKKDLWDPYEVKLLMQTVKAQDTVDWQFTALCLNRTAKACYAKYHKLKK